MSRPALLLLALSLSAPALALEDCQYTDEGKRFDPDPSTPGCNPVPNPSSGDSSAGGNSGLPWFMQPEDPAVTAQKRIVEEQKRKQAAADFEQVEKGQQALDTAGAAARSRIQTVRDRTDLVLRLEGRPSEVASSLAPVVVAPSAGPRESLADRVRRLNEEERARQKGLRIGAVPPPPPGGRGGPPLPRVELTSPATMLDDLQRLRESYEQRKRDMFLHAFEDDPEKLAGPKSFKDQVEATWKIGDRLTAMGTRQVEAVMSFASRVVDELADPFGATNVTAEDADALSNWQRAEALDAQRESIGDQSSGPVADFLMRLQGGGE